MEGESMMVGRQDAWVGQCKDLHQNDVIRISNVDTPAEGGTWVLLAAILGSSMAFIDGTVISVALPALQHAFHASGTTLQWVIEAYALALASFLLLGGSFGDVYGRKKVFLVGVTLFACSSAVCGLAVNSLMIMQWGGLVVPYSSPEVLL
jgi:hypothetical protein